MEKYFEPYNSFSFKVKGTKANKMGEHDVVLIIVETNLPVLTVKVPEYIIE